MLSADHVRARVTKGELVLTKVTPAQRARLVEVAELLLVVTLDQVGQSRADLEEAWGTLEVAPKEKKLLEGLIKLVEDVCHFAEGDAAQAADLRREVFLRSAELRRQAETVEAFDRAQVLTEVAGARGLEAQAVDAALYADLRGAQEFLTIDPLTPADLVERWERGQIQAVLLRATRIVAQIHTQSAEELRTLFRKLKFHRLLHTFHTLGPGEHRVEIDGPYSLFDSVTKYGLGLALMLPALEACQSLELTADIRWGKARQALVFRHSVARKPASKKGAPPKECSQPGAALEASPSIPLADEISALLKSFEALQTLWKVAVASVVLELPGVGSCMPDLVFTHPESSTPVYLELLGFWSREAVWRRVELVEQGLPQRILFAASARLRVSEEVLDPEASAALYVFKGVMSARTVEERLNRLVECGKKRKGKA